jgi:predicted methyltransferase
VSGSEPLASATDSAASAADPRPDSASAAEASQLASGTSPAGPGTTDMLGFIGIGRGERVAELGAGTRDSVEQMVQAVGPAGVVYVRHDPRTLTALPSTREGAKPSDALPANVVLMTTRDEAVLDAAVKDLNVATLLFSYHDLVARGIDRRRLNLAVYRALVPSGTFVIADLAPPPGTSAEAARKLNRVDERLVRTEVEAAGFVLADSAELVTSAARGGSDPTEHGGQYILKFRKAR